MKLSTKRAQRAATRNKAVVLTGPTAVGKTALTDSLFSKGFEIINADSVQIYRGLDIGSAKPSEDLQRRIPHHLIDIRDPWEDYSSGDFVNDALAAMKGIWERGNIPLITGGTMYYIKHLVYGPPETPPADPAVREAVAAECREKGGEWGDGVLRVKAFGSTDVGVSFLVEMEGERIFHAGDLNNWHWKDESTAEEARAANLAFLRELDVLSRQAGSVDVACFPVDPRLGADYALGARQFVDKVRPRVFVPMHFWGDYGKANAFQAYAEMRGCRFWALHRPGERVEIEGDELKYK